MLSDISRVVLAFTRKSQANTTTTLVARLREGGHYATISDFPLTSDPWTVEVTVRRANGMRSELPFLFRRVIRMTYEFFGHTYTLLNPAWLWLLVFLPVLWLPVTLAAAP